MFLQYLFAERNRSDYFITTLRFRQEVSERSRTAQSVKVNIEKELLIL